MKWSHEERVAVKEQEDDEDQRGDVLGEPEELVIPIGEMKLLKKKYV